MLMKDEQRVFKRTLRWSTRFTKIMRRPGFEPGLPDWQSDVLDQTGRPSP